MFHRPDRLPILTNILEECLIDFAELVSDHSGETMATTVWATLCKYGLQAKVSGQSRILRSALSRINKIIAFVMDNATNNDTMTEAIERKCQAAGIPFDAGRSRMRCMPHTVHLAALKVRDSDGFSAL